MGRAFPAFRSHSRALVLALLALGVLLVSGAASSQANAQRSAVKGGLFNRRPRAEPVPAEQPQTEELELAAEPKPQTEESAAARLQKEQLYEAYNMLHSLAQDFHKPFDAPAVLVVGHQTSGKSALIEALMGFQFNQVGGGTKTRRPIALRMQYNPRCSSPMCFLTLENGKEEPRTLQDIQAYIEAENKRLERDPVRCYDQREIMIRMEYRYCPNMIVIDTPGLLNAPRKMNQLNPQQRALAQAAREAENLVLAKMRCKDYIILCVEDTTDWKHATTRNVVMQVDPELSRTVLVTTKLDTKIPQFGETADLEDFLRAPLIRKLYPRLLGGPFFTTVPCGRVGTSGNHQFPSNEAFVGALRQAERYDRQLIQQRVGDFASTRPLMNRVGLASLRSFLERRVEESYRRNVAKIVPLLQSEFRNAELKLGRTDQELAALSVEKLRSSANLFRERFVQAMTNAIQGSIAASPEDHGETLEQEQLRGGSFLEQDLINSEHWQRLLDLEVGNANHKLYGGAQYHRALREFAVAVRHMKTPVITEDEIANAAGVGDLHDGVNFLRAACVIAVEKAKSSFEPMLEALRHRMIHIMKRLYPIVEHMLAKSGHAMSAVQTKQFQDIVRKLYDSFVEEVVEGCIDKCRDDIRAQTRFVTWDLHDRSAGALQRSIPPQSNLVEVYSVAIDTKTKRGSKKENASRQKQQQKRNDLPSTSVRVIDQWEQANGGSDQLVVSSMDHALHVTEAQQMADYQNLLQFMEEVACQRDANRTAAVISALVQHIIMGWRDHFAKVVTMKFNCFFLMSFLDDFPYHLRNELDKVYEKGLAELFDISEARAALQLRRQELVAECEANQKLQERFDTINEQMQASFTQPIPEGTADDSLNYGIRYPSVGEGDAENATAGTHAASSAEQPPAPPPPLPAHASQASAAAEDDILAALQPRGAASQSAMSAGKFKRQ